MHNGTDNAVMVTGMGLALPTGRGLQRLWEDWSGGRSSIVAYQDDLLHGNVGCFAHVSPELLAQAQAVVPHKLRRYTVGFIGLSVLAALDALTDTGEHWQCIDETRRGLYTGQGDSTVPSIVSFARALIPSCREGEVDVQRLTHEALHRRGADPFTIIKALSNNTLALNSMVHRFRGDCGAFVQDAAAAHAALARASFSLRHRYCDIALVVGSGSYNECLRLAEHRVLGHLSAARCGPRSLLSFDQDRDGTVLGEGAVAFVLERGSDVRERGGKALLEIVGLAGTACTSHEHAGGTYAKVLTSLLAQHPEVKPGFVCADGKGTLQHDAIEIGALERAFGKHSPPVTSIRPVIGTVSAASPLADLAAISSCFTHERIPGIGTLQSPASAELDFVTQKHRPSHADAALCTYQSFNGFCGALLVRRPS